MKIRLSNPRQTKKLLQQYDINLKRSLGQNLLVDDTVLSQIIGAAEITSQDTVVEIGAGLGALTEKLAEEANQVVAIELDRRLISVLEDVLAEYNNIELIEGDARKVDFDQLAGTNYKVVANLPYNVANPIIMRVLEEDFNVDDLTVMVQKEVAARMTADPGGKEYGILSIAMQYYSDPVFQFTVPPTAFIPPPKVESAVINCQVREEPKIKVKDEEFFFKVVRAAFQQRRKTIRNALRKAANLDLTTEVVDEALQRAEIDSRRRGEKLSITKFGTLSNQLFGLIIDTED